jgi:hypothetical protein
LRKILGQKRDRKYEEDGGKIHEVLHNLHSLPHIIMIKSIRMKRARHVARMEKKINAYRILVGNSEMKNHLWSSYE